MSADGVDLASLVLPWEDAPAATSRAAAPAVPVVPSGRSTGYAQAALVRECEKVASTLQGSRNHQLNAAAFNLGQLVSGGELSESDARTGLADAAQAAGLGTVESSRTVESGLAVGAREPRTAPPAKGAQGTWKGAGNPIAAGDSRRGAPSEATSRRVQITWANEITMRPVVWAWEDSDGGRIPAGSLSIAAGREGTGKSAWAADLAAQISRGRLTGSLYGSPRRVLYVAVEDSWEHTLAPRLAVAGADLGMVGRFDVIEQDDEQTILSLPSDNALLEATIREYHVGAVILDPLMSLLGEGIDTHRTRDVRRALDPLVQIADRTGCLMVGIAHFNKGAGTDPSSLITGSGAFKDVPRSVFGFVRDSDADDGTRVMTQTKNSLGRDTLPSLKYVIETATLQTPEGTAAVGRLSWRGTSDRSAQDILRDAGTSPEDRDERTDAASWLRDYLTDHGGEAAVNDVRKAGASAGFTADSLKRAKAKAGVRSRKAGLADGWVWALHHDDSPEGSTKGAKGARSETVLPSPPSVLPSGTEGAVGTHAPPRVGSSQPHRPAATSQLFAEVQSQAGEDASLLARPVGPRPAQRLCVGCGQPPKVDDPDRDTCARCEHLRVAS